jgi:hypothetical protein
VFGSVGHPQHEEEKREKKKKKEKGREKGNKRKGSTYSPLTRQYLR